MNYYKYKLFEDCGDIAVIQYNCDYIRCHFSNVLLLWLEAGGCAPLTLDWRASLLTHHGAEKKPQNILG